MRGNTSSKRKLIVASVIVGVVLLGAIISIVAVLAATTQNVNSSVNVTYTVSDVSATVTARYARAGAVSTSDSDKTNKYFVDAGEVTFYAQDATRTGNLNFGDELKLASTNAYVTYEFGFDNNSTLGFTAQLTGAPAATNMTLAYYVSDSKVEPNSVDAASFEVFYTKDTNNISAVKTAVAGGNTSVSYVYIRATIVDLNTAAGLSGNFAWSLTSAAA